MEYWRVYEDDPTWWRGKDTEVVDLGKGNYGLKDSFEITGISSNKLVPGTNLFIILL